MNKINMLQASLYNLSTAFPQKLWKNIKSPRFSITCIVLLSCFVLVSCSYVRKVTGKPQPVMENALISMNEDEVRKKLGEPTMVSLTPENKIIWTYRPEWKIMPDNKGTVYVEFNNGKVTKVIKAEQ